MISSFGPMTAERKARVWQLWRQGNPMSVIARDIAKPPATVYSYLLYHGGISRGSGLVDLVVYRKRKVRTFWQDLGWRFK
jgi:hypothetical protein